MRDGKVIDTSLFLRASGYHAMSRSLGLPKKYSAPIRRQTKNKRQGICMKATTILALCVRILIACCTRTFFQPDEYLQSLEPAHALVFGYGHLTWEWLTTRPIRSVIYPALNVPVYWVLKVTGVDNVCPSLIVRVSWSIACQQSHQPLTNPCRSLAPNCCTVHLLPRQMCGLASSQQS